MLNKYWKYYTQKYIGYSRFFERNGKDEASYFRDKLFVSILLLTLLFGIPSYILTSVVVLLKDYDLIFAMSTAALIILLFIIFNKTMSFEFRKSVFSINFLTLAFSVVTILGLKGNGDNLILLITVLMTLYSGRTVAFNAVFVSVVFYVLLLVNIYFELLALPAFKDEDFMFLVITVVNNVLFNLLAIISVSFLLRQLEKALSKANDLKLELTDKQKSIIEAKNKAEKSDSLKTAFLANMNHEIRTPMYGVLGCANFLKSYNTNDEQYQDYLNIITNSSEQLISVMTDIINVSKIESNLVSVTVSTFNITHVIDEVHQKLLAKASEKNIFFKKKNNIEIQDSFIRSDRKKIDAILTYIISNAIKYTKSGSVELLCERFDKKQIAFYIKDTGIGINKRDFKSIFSTFNQVDYKNRNALHGIGVGLTIAKAYIEMLGGNVYLKSEEGLGSTFWFTIDVDYRKNEI